MTVKKQTQNGIFSGYLVNDNTFFPKENCELINQWIADGNKPEPEFTKEELLKQKQDKFRVDRNILLDKTDKAINKAEDLGESSIELRTYRQALRDATINWIMPESIL